jgi:Arc/MetJ-type ribon-helix-helix transcriptional regulator
MFGTRGACRGGICSSLQVRQLFPPTSRCPTVLPCEGSQITEVQAVAAYPSVLKGDDPVYAFPLTSAVRLPSLNPMEVHLTPDQKDFVRQAIESGRLNREEEAVQEALSLWEQRERTRAEILAAVDVAEASVARGEGRVITQESMRQLADEVKQRGRNRLTAERSSAP